jgi:Trp operon repressor
VEGYLLTSVDERERWHPIRRTDEGTLSQREVSECLGISASVHTSGACRLAGQRDQSGLQGVTKSNARVSGLELNPVAPSR